MKKAFIPLGISGGFAIFSLVAAVALTGALGGGSFTPEVYEIEGGTGTDSHASSPEELRSLMGQVAFHSGGYYDDLKNLDPSQPDPSPEPGKINSLGIIFEGKGTTWSGAYLDRTLTIAQNEKAVYYQAVGTEKDGDRTLNQDAIVSISRKGMFVKYNAYAVTYSAPTSDPYEQMQRDMLAALCSGVNDNLGKWYTVGLSDAHLEELAQQVQPYETDKYAHWFALNLANQYATDFKGSFISAVDSNNNFISEMTTIINSVTDFVDTNNVYRGTYNNYDVTIDFTSAVAPSFNYSNLSRGGDVSETATFKHVNNAIVPIADSSSGDIFDLIGKPIEDYIRKQLGY